MAKETSRKFMMFLRGVFFVLDLFLKKRNNETGLPIDERETSNKLFQKFLTIIQNLVLIVPMIFRNLK